MHRWIMMVGLAVGALSMAWLGYGCGQTSFGSCTDSATCVPPDSGDDGTLPGVDGAGSSSGTGPDATGGQDGGNGIPGDGATTGDSSNGDAASCNVAGEPKDEACLVNDPFGVFVAAGAGSAGNGTREAPFATIAAGLAHAGTNRRVFVCAGTYPEQLVVGNSVDGVAVYGGFDCTGWNYAATNKVKVAPTTPGYALEVDSLTTGVTFEDIEFDAQDAQAPGASSIAVFANQTIATFRRVVMNAGKGAAGAMGDAGMNYPGDAGRAASGNEADSGAGAPPQVCNCLNGDQTIGGAGGSTSSDGSKGHPLFDDGGAGGYSGTGTCSVGNGAGTPDGPSGAGAAIIGSLTTNGWSPASGTSGGIASVAQGGGGGGGNAPVGGASGGCGGCGGGGGVGGQGGGASFALLSSASVITLDSCQLTAGDAGFGGPGGVGQSGQLGGYSGIPVPPGCAGGTGGTGGGGGGGGGGAGGLSAATGYSGSPPTQTGGTTLTHGAAGSGGAGGTGGGASNAGAMGLNGMAGDTISF